LEMMGSVRDVSPLARVVLRVLELAPGTAEELARETKLPVGVVDLALTELVNAGRARGVEGKRFVAERPSVDLGMITRAMSSKKKFVEGKWRYVHDDGTPGMPCAPPTDEDRRAEEAEEQRRKYQAKADETGEETWWRGEKVVPKGTAIAAPTPEARLKVGTLTYKVITQRDEFFGGKFDPEKLERLVNRLAAEGWRVVSVATADVSTFFGAFWAGRGARQEIVVFMEKTTE